MLQPAVFFDRDGTIIQEAEYLSDPAKVAVLPQAAEGIRRLRAANYLAIVTSNQSGVARGYFDEDTVKRVNARVAELFLAQGAQLDAVYYCPHYAKGTVAAYARECDCRKPKPGMILQAAREHGVDLARSWVVGDKPADIEFGRALGLRTVLVLTGYGQESRDAGFAPGAGPDYIAADLNDAAQFILKQQIQNKA